MARKTIPEALLEAGTRFVSRAAQAVLENPRGQEAVARAVGFAQNGRKRLEAVQERVLSAAGIPGRKDYEDLARQLARVKRKTRELSERLQGVAPPVDSSRPERWERPGEEGLTMRADEGGESDRRTENDTR